MSKCEGQKAECYQAGICHYCHRNFAVDSGMLAEVFDEPMNWGSSILVWAIYVGLSVFLMWIGFLAAQFFN